MKKFVVTALILLTSAAMPAHAEVEEYIFDKEGKHAFIQFRIKHLGFSWLYGRFNDFDGRFSYDKSKDQNNKVEVTINTASVDTNHPPRDKHLREADFLDVAKYPTAKFVSTKYDRDENGNGGKLHGDLTLHGVTRKVVIRTEEVGGGKDPWGGFRRGFYGTTEIKLSDFNIKKDLGPASQKVELMLSIEGIRQDKAPAKPANMTTQ